MQRNDKKKICVVVSSLARGGAEKSSGILTILLDHLGHHVQVVTVLPDVDFKFEGKVLNLSELKGRNGRSLSRFQKFFLFRKFLKDENFDVVIDNRSRNSFFREIIVSRLLYIPTKTIYVVRSFNLKNYFISPASIARYLYQDAMAVVGVSETISQAIREKYRLRNVLTIYNTTLNNNRADDIDNNGEEYILFYGRLNNYIKNISLLLSAYKLSNLPTNNIQLKILGSGQDLQTLQEEVKLMGLKTVEFLPYMPNPEEHIKKAKYVVLTSRYEGFPRVLLESLSLEIPVISVDCNSGPSEIIVDGFNGLLVENHNPEALANAMDILIENQTLYSFCKSNASKSVEKFSFKKVAEDWENLLNKI